MPEEDVLGTEEKKLCCKRRTCIGITAFFLLAFGIAGATVTCFVLEKKVLKHRHHYGVIFDAGSSHTDVTVYRWPSEFKDHGTAHTTELVFTNCSEHGISSFVGKPDKAGETIKECIEDIVLKAIPHKDVKKTLIYLGATAGMRLLCKRDMPSCEAILQSVRSAFNNFVFRQTKDRVKVLTGQEEALFGWTTANILNGPLNGSKTTTNSSMLLGALDMGGGSLEISFIPKDLSVVPTDYLSNVTLYGKEYTLYTQSYLCYGFNEAHRKLMANLVKKSNYSLDIIHPCLNRDLNITRTASDVWLAPCSNKPSIDIFPLNNETVYKFIGSGSVKECHHELKRIFNKTECERNNATCPFNEFQPPLSGKFAAFSGFSKTAKFLNITSGQKLSGLDENSQAFCEKDWEEVTKEYGSLRFLKSICFQGLYSYEVLTNGLRFDKNSTDVLFKDKISGAEVGWSLGFMLNTTNSIPIESPSYRISKQEFVALLVIFSLLGIIGLALLVVCVFKKRFKKNLKYKYSQVN